MFAQAGPNSGVVLFWEAAFPAADISQVSPEIARKIFSACEFAAADELQSKLPRARVLVMPFGSSFPELQWPAIRSFLRRGGNLVVLGGRPFTRPAYKGSDGRWKLRSETPAFARALRIYSYQPTSGTGLTFESNPELVGAQLPKFAWTNAWSLVVRLSENSIDEREGSAGSLDATLRALAWGVRQGRRLSAPAVEIDHTQHAFVGGRWELLTCDPGPDFWSAPSTPSLVQSLIERAAEGASEFRFQPQFAVFAAGEPWRFELLWDRPGAGPQALRIEVTIQGDGAKSRTERLDFTPTQLPFEIGFELKPSPKARGLQHVTARLLEGDRVVAVHHTGFWMRNDALLRSGPLVSKDSNFFLMGGKPTLIVGTTYMASDVQRQYFEYPNPFVWDRDMEQIAGAGLNMLRTGWWTGWERLSENELPTEKTLRALEAYLLTAQRHQLPVQFTLFAFTPPGFPGGQGSGPYFGHAKQQEAFIRAVVERFHSVPYLMWDLINEPSFSNPNRTWITRPTNDAWEQGEWNNWVLRKYGSLQAVSEAWHVDVPNGLLQLPTDADFSARGALTGASPARAFDYHLFAQESFANWAAMMRDAIRSTGSTQLVTVGQDEGGVTTRPLTAYFAPAVDFTTNHTWWLNDALLWDSLAAKQPGLPLLIQETGVQHETNLDGTPRLTDEQEAELFERKLAIALGTGAGAIQWLWNTNSYMMPEMELSIGALREDKTEKPEAEILKNFAAFAKNNSDVLRDPVAPDIVVVTSHALQLSPYGEMALAAQQRGVRALHYELHLSASVLAENQLEHLGSPKLVVLPSPQALSQRAWQHLLDYVYRGGNLLVTGPVERDEHWSATKRLSEMLETKSEPLRGHNSELEIAGEPIGLSFDSAAQQQLERLAIPARIAAVPLGAGRIYVTADPIELAESPESTVKLYRSIANSLGLRPAFDGSETAAGVMIRATELHDAVLYLFVSEASANHGIDIVDRITGTTLKLTLRAMHARLAVIRKSDRSVRWSPE